MDILTGKSEIPKQVQNDILLGYLNSLQGLLRSLGRDSKTSSGQKYIETAKWESKERR